MAESNYVVQGNVVQGNVVQPAPPAVVQGAVVQPAIVGQPLGVNYGGYVQPVHGNSADTNAAGMGWVLYGMGCFLCIACGPVGPLFWFAVAAIHYCKPKDERDKLNQEAQVAKCSLITGFCSLVAVAGFILMIVVFLAWARSQETEFDNSQIDYCGIRRKCDNVREDVVVCQRLALGYCKYASPKEVFDRNCTGYNELLCINGCSKYGCKGKR
eukprot:TRINITY_DN11102_c1_g1_i1.p1 TRINITY_DN11102_c1_g1~~TRINITY_DN11102_c1_g1_i1.p1  ORF type:complete len:213 (+),score=18.84 TRINITY_DN11102_c1_g1_i1:122-760(+)